jgi:hypothetical protein
MRREGEGGAIANESGPVSLRGRGWKEGQGKAYDCVNSKPLFSA